MDFLETLVQGAIGNKYYTKALSPLLGLGDSIAVSPMPSNNYEHYYDGSYRQGYAFKVLTKHENQLVAYNTLNQIAKDLADIGDIPSLDGTYVFEGITIKTDTSMIGQDEKRFVFGAQFSAALYITDN